MSAIDPVTDVDTRRYPSQPFRMVSLEDLLENERAVAAAKNVPYAVEEKIELTCDVGAPCPTLLHGESCTHLLYYLDHTEEAVGLITFERCIAIRTDQRGENYHPLQGSGWCAYSLLRIQNSNWPPNPAFSDVDFAHFVYSFHDSTVECLAESYKVAQLVGPIANAIKPLLSELI